MEQAQMLAKQAKHVSRPTMTVQRDDTQLVIIDPELVKNELQVVRSEKPEDHALGKAADEYVAKLLGVDSHDFKAQEDRKAAVEGMGLSIQRDASRRSKMLLEPVRTLSEKGADGGDVANALVDLKMKVEELDPNRYDFDAGFATRMLGWIPGVGKPLKRYFTQYESAQTVIDAILKSLENGREQLRRDNKTLVDDQVAMRELTYRLDRAVKLGQLIDEKLAYKVEQEIPQEDPRYKFVQEELRFPLVQRIQDLQQQLAVNQQGVLAVEIIVRNNNELVRGVNRAINVTISALQVAVTVAMALAHQRIVLDKITALNTTTSHLISSTAARLRTQGVEVHKQASQTMLDMEALKSAFRDINAAMQDISSFRQASLPKMAQTVLEMDALTREAEQTIQRMEEGNRVAPSMTIEVE